MAFCRGGTLLQKAYRYIMMNHESMYSKFGSMARRLYYLGVILAPSSG